MATSELIVIQLIKSSFDRTSFFIRLLFPSRNYREDSLFSFFFLHGVIVECSGLVTTIKAVKYFSLFAYYIAAASYTVNHLV